MNESEQNIDVVIREALIAEEALAFDRLGEQGIFGMAMDAFSGRNRLLTSLMMVVAVILFGLAVYSAVRFFQAEEVKALIGWASGFFLFMLATTSIKIWWWMEMEKNATMREIKRVELLLANVQNTLQNLAGKAAER
jgi:hypothetical protein